MTKTKCDKYCRARRDPEAEYGDMHRCEHKRYFMCYRSASDFRFAFWTRITPLRNPFLYLKARKYLK